MSYNNFIFHFIFFVTKNTSLFFNVKFRGSGVFYSLLNVLKKLEKLYIFFNFFI